MKINKVKTRKSSALSKAVTNVKQIIKKKDKLLVKKQVLDKSSKKDKKVDTKQKLEKSNSTDKKKEKEFRSTRGVVYIGHIPYGFFEDEMKEYFQQFGSVTRVRVVRSSKTGKSRGYGYVEFLTPEVAKIAAETMNNYLMCGRLLKTSYIPPEKQHWGFFSHKAWTTKKYPRRFNQIVELKKNASPITELNYHKNVRRSLRQITALEEKLKSSGINIKFKLADTPKLT